MLYARPLNDPRRYPSSILLAVSGRCVFVFLYTIAVLTVGFVQVKGIGHCNVNNMSSTTGVLIHMTKFREIELSNDKQSVRLGMGLTWGEVYTALDGTGVGVVGGRLLTVGKSFQKLSVGTLTCACLRRGWPESQWRLFLFDKPTRICN
jgi:hypothetical protein